MTRTSALNLAGAVLLCIAGVSLAACNNQMPPPEPVPGQPLTWAQQHAKDLAQYQEDHENRKQDHCPRRRCM